MRWLLAGALLLPVLACKDTVRIVNSAGNEHGVLLDGHTDGINANDKTFVSLATDIDVGPVNGSAVHNELIGFTNRRPTAVRVAPGWGNAADTVNLTFPDEIAIPVTVRIVRGPFDAQRQRALDASITTSAIWSSERMGVRFAPFEILDATTDPDASNYFDFTCSQRTGIQNDIGRTNGRINIYYVDTVDGGTGRGQAC